MSLKVSKFQDFKMSRFSLSSRFVKWFQNWKVLKIVKILKSWRLDTWKLWKLQTLKPWNLKLLKLWNPEILKEFSYWSEIRTFQISRFWNSSLHSRFSRSSWLLWFQNFEDLHYLRGFKISRFSKVSLPSRFPDLKILGPQCFNIFTIFKIFMLWKDFKNLVDS